MKIDEDAPLNRYLVKHLQPLTEADPALLANYVVALLKNNKPKKDLQKLCIEQLYDFLGEGTKGFVIKLFHALEDGTIQTSQGEKETLNHAAPVSLIDDVRESRVSPRRIEKASSLTGQAKSDQEDGTDDEDDDRNHKHKRRATRSRSFERDGQDDDEEDDEDGRAGDVADGGPHKKRNRLTEEQLQGNADRSITLLRQGCSAAPMEREVSLRSERRVTRDQMHSFATRSSAEGIQRGVLRGVSSAVRGEVPLPKYDGQNGILRGPLGKGRGLNNGPWSSHEQRYHPFDGSDYKDSLLPPGPPNIFQGRAIPTRGNAPHVPWVGFGHIAGIGNGSLDQLLPLNAGMQGGRAVPISHSIGVGINMGMGMTIGRPRCPDFEERGYCLRGDLCPMEHGANRIVVEDVQSLSQFNLPVALPSGRGIGTPSGPLSAPASVSTPSNTAFRSRILRESVDDSGILNGTLPSTTVAEPDLYDPDQPLWNKDRLDVGVEMRRLPSFKRGQDDQDLDSALLERRGHKTDDDDVEADRHARIAAGLPGGQPGSSVWNRIGPIDRSENKEDIVSVMASGEGPSQGKFTRKDTSEDQQGRIKTGQGKKLENELHLKSDLDEVAKATPANFFHGKQIIGIRGESAAHHVDGRNHGPRPGGQRANSSSSNERAQRTLYVSCIPVSSNRKELLLVHFQKFGEILDIRIPLHSDRAFVQYCRREDAEAALLSPEAVMGNRFIRLSWANRDSISDTGEAKMLPPLSERVASSGTAVQPHASAAKGKEKAVNISASVDTSARESARKLISANVQPASSVPSIQTKQEELEQMKEEIRKKQEELAQKRDEFRKKLNQLSQQGTATKTDSDVEQPFKRSKSEEREGSSISLSKSSCPGAAALPAAAESGRTTSEQSISTTGAQKLSVDAPKSTFGQFLSNASQPSPIRSPFPRQSMTWGPTRYKLDNRTTIFRLFPPFPDGFGDIGVIREHFASFGDLSSIDLEESEGQKPAEGSKLTQTSVIRVTFANRRSAERAFIQGRWFQGSSLQLVWFPGANTAGVTAITKSQHLESMCKNNVSPKTAGHCLDGASLVEGGMQKQQEGACGGARSDDNLIEVEDKSVKTEENLPSVNLDEGKDTELSHESHKQGNENQQTEVLKISENNVPSDVSMNLGGDNLGITPSKSVQ